MDSMVTAEEIFGRPVPPVPWPTTRPVLELAIEMLPVVADKLTADLVTLLVEALVDVTEEMSAVRAGLSSSLDLLHAQQSEIVRLRERLAGLLDELRRDRKVVT